MSAAKWPTNTAIFTIIKRKKGFDVHEDIYRTRGNMSWRELGNYPTLFKANAEAKYSAELMKSLGFKTKIVPFKVRRHHV
jgi:hypothetical protein